MGNKKGVTTMSGYAERARAARQDRTLKWPEGDYKVLLKGFKKQQGRSAPYNDMVNLELAVLEGPGGAATEDVNKLIDKGRRITYRFIFSAKGFGFDDFLIFLEDLGADLSKTRNQAEDPEYQDLLAILRQTDRTPPEMEINLTRQKDNPQYDNIKIKTVEKVFTPAPATAAPAAAAETLYYVKDGVAALATRPQIQELVNQGYTGQVNINNTGWKTALDAGFVLPAPVEAAPAIPEVAAPAVEAPPAAPVADPAKFVVEQDNTIPADTAAALGQQQAADTPAAPAQEAPPAAPAQDAIPAPPAAEAPAEAPAAGAPVDPFAAK